ncbi:RND transporter [Alkanindiges hydrocarboniclasticus]|uniref:RND transporter n=1 Tax=Alkanindiges hydrocarboniclasticus TaxID=1907941 RepID=A0A1S8CWM2_9GAMM|nr:HlyD family secretion protein [Alkanindiges hydrocarboniclasticus]ONG41424.1 RND transporter [Alkanindiges hydrocarboniclasticus]
MNKRKRLPKIILAIFLVLAVLGLIYYFLVYRFYESTDNAYLKADVTWVSPRVSGEIIQLNVKSNQEVKAGQVLMKLDDRDTQARYEQANAITALKAAALDVQRQNIAGQQAMIAEAQAGLEAANAEMNRLKKDYDRYQQLLREGVTTRQRMETVQSQYLSALAQVKRAQAGVVAAQAQLGGVQASREQLVADVNSAKANVNLIGVDASSAQVVAPVSGTIGDLAVRLGSRVNPQTRLLAIVPLEKTFVEANFKETQITEMHIGQKVTVELDAYPEHEFTGHIDSFSPASGAEFSLMPPENATGNFNKVVQRVPVKILLDRKAGDPVLRPGLSATVKVDLRT